MEHELEVYPKVGAALPNHHPRITTTASGGAACLEGALEFQANIILEASAAHNPLELLRIPKDLRPGEPVQFLLKEVKRAEGSYYCLRNSRNSKDWVGPVGARLEISRGGSVDLFIGDGRDSDTIFLDGCCYPLPKASFTDESSTNRRSAKVVPSDEKTSQVANLLQAGYEWAGRLTGPGEDVTGGDIQAIANYVKAVAVLADAMVRYEEHIYALDDEETENSRAHTMIDELLLEAANFPSRQIGRYRSVLVDMRNAMK